MLDFIVPRRSKYFEVKGATQKILLILNEKNANKADFFLLRALIFDASLSLPLHTLRLLTFFQKVGGHR